MAKRFLDIIEFTYNTSEAYKTKVVELLWTIHYWPLGRQLLEELTRTATDKLFTPKLLIENFAGGHDYKEFHGGGSLPSELGHLTSTWTTVVRSRTKSTPPRST